jgi:hypothetical protein
MIMMISCDTVSIIYIYILLDITIYIYITLYNFYITCGGQPLMMESYPLIRVVESIGNNPKVTDYEMVLNHVKPATRNSGTKVTKASKLEVNNPFPRNPVLMCLCLPATGIRTWRYRPKNGCEMGQQSTWGSLDICQWREKCNENHDFHGQSLDLNPQHSVCKSWKTGSKTLSYVQRVLFAHVPKVWGPKKSQKMIYSRK